MVSVLVISGSMGSGKTTVLGEASDILTVRAGWPPFTDPSSHFAE